MCWFLTFPRGLSFYKETALSLSVIRTLISSSKADHKPPEIRDEGVLLAPIRCGTCCSSRDAEDQVPGHVSPPSQCQGAREALNIGKQVTDGTSL